MFWCEEILEEGKKGALPEGAPRNRRKLGLGIRPWLAY